MKLFRLHHTLKKVWQIDLSGIGVCLLMLAAAFWLGVLPVMQQAEVIASQKQQVVSVAEDASQMIASRSELYKRLAKVKRAVDAAAFELRSVKQLNLYLSQLTQLAESSNLTLHEIQPGKSTLEPHYWSVPVIMSGTGRYQACAQFLHQLHASFPNTRLSSLKLTASAGNSLQPTAKFRMGLVWHAAQEP